MQGTTADVIDGTPASASPEPFVIASGTEDDVPLRHTETTPGVMDSGFDGPLAADASRESAAEASEDETRRALHAKKAGEALDFEPDTPERLFGEMREIDTDGINGRRMSTVGHELQGGLGTFR